MKLGVMADCSRNAVPTIDTLKSFAEQISRMGYRELLLYAEDVIDVPGIPEFGYMRGAYSAEEIRRLDEFCTARGIELVPCVQTLAHLEGVFRHPRFQPLADIGGILYIGKKEVYDWIATQLNALASCFSSRKIHLGMDEANLSGLGRMLFEKGYREKHELMSEHLQRVKKLAEQSGFLDCRVWYDQFAWSAYGDDFYGGEKILHPEFCAAFPEDVELVYWDYGEWCENPHEPDNYIRHIERYRKISPRVSMAGCAWKWVNFAPDNTNSAKVNTAQIAACRKCGVEDYLVTMWADGGGEASLFSVLPALYDTACAAREREPNPEEFRKITGADYFELLSLDGMNKIFGDSGAVNNQSRNYLYADPLLGTFDEKVRPGTGVRYAELARKYAVFAEKHADTGANRYRVLFDAMSALAAVLEIKAEFGVKLRATYRAGDRAGMRALIAEGEELLRRLGNFARAFRRQWESENKTFGFEAFCQKLGGLRMRIEDTVERLTEWTEFRRAEISELENEILAELPGDADTLLRGYPDLVTYGKFPS